jgi:hypothetical protein
MLDGKIPPDLPTEMKLALVAVIEDQLNQAYENLLHAVGYNVPKSPPESSADSAEAA